MDKERKRIIGLCDGLRTTDINDGMDFCGLKDIGLVAYDIHALWRDTENFGHRIYGFAHTVRFLPTNRRPTAATGEEFRDFKGHWYGAYAKGPHDDEIQAGDIIVIDGHETGTGFIGSNNAQSWINHGAVGVVTNGACRDSDELIRQRVPVYHRYTRATIRPQRVELDATNVPLNIGGVLVRPGDLVVADGDGVVVVPIEHVDEVLKWARHEAGADRKSRRALLEDAGLGADETVRDLEN
jgi:regulator of RNase E activity RraA